MDLSLDPSLSANYKNKSQVARVVTETWGQRNLFCAACNADSLHQLRANRRARDFECPQCSTTYQLKARSRPGLRVADAAYDAMIEAIRSDSVPALFVLTYTSEWKVRELLLVHPAFFSESCVARRRPLKPTARRANAVLCDILLSRIAPAGILPVVQDGAVTPPHLVRERYRMAEPLRKVSTAKRGWTLDVLRVVQALPEWFSLDDVYRFEDELQALHPHNKHVKDKIRQQLQVLRDLNYIEFLDRRGTYRRIK
jgi:type II restriction enzyme